MSTKSSYLYGKNFHFYFDHMDGDYHLEVNEKEIEMPKDFKNTLIELTHLKMSIETINRSLERLKKIEDTSRW